MHRIGFDVVLESAYLKIGRHIVELIHAPSNPPPAHFQLHGHVHEKRPNTLVSNQLNLSVEVWDYKPVSESTLISIFDKASNRIITESRPLYFIATFIVLYPYLKPIMSEFFS